MKNFVLFSVLVTATGLLASFRLPCVVREADLLGEWQLGSKVLSSNKRATYTFAANKTFVYSTDGQDALIEVLDIRGTYSLKKDTVYVRPLAITKQIGGKLSKNLYTTINDSWEITDGVIKTVKLPHGPQYPLIIKVISSRKILEIDGSLYYKI